MVISDFRARIKICWSIFDNSEPRLLSRSTAARETSDGLTLRSGPIRQTISIVGAGVHVNNLLELQLQR